jgi:DNA-directed RNA polymerase subunit RPC12/RpoP
VPTYKCQQCGTEIILSKPPQKCDFCGGKKFKVIQKKNSKSSPIKVAGDFSGRFELPSGISSKLPPPSKSSRQTPLPLPLPPPTPPTSSKKFYDPFVQVLLQFLAGLLESQYLKWILLAISLTGLGGLGYWFWESQFDTREFQKVILKEDFTNPRGWRLTQGARLKDGGLFQAQKALNAYAASIWIGRNFGDSDFSAQVLKVQGANNLAFGIASRFKINNFYYLLINGNGDIKLGKHTGTKWQHQVVIEKSHLVYTDQKKNILRLVCKQDLIIGFVNGQRIGSFRDKTHQSGKIALITLRGKGNPLQVYFDNIIVKERLAKAPISANTSPKDAVKAYYQKVAQADDNSLRLIKDIKIYALKTLSKSHFNSQIKVWLKYSMKNGLTICESRVVDLEFDIFQQQWKVKSSAQVVRKPSCKR